MPKGIPYERPTSKCLIRVYSSDLDKLKRYYPSGYTYPLLLLIEKHVRDLESHAKRELERAGITAQEIEALG